MSGARAVTSWITGLSLLATVGAAAPPPPEQQIAAAVQAAPVDRREGAQVLGFDPAGKLVELRAGSNDLVCLADTPGDESFSVSCYHRSLEPYMRRGRELKEQGMTDADERLKRRWQEAEAGKLEMPKAPATLYVLTGKGFDPVTGTVSDAYLRYVVYVPGATVESTGLALQPSGPGSPWLMFPGTPGAHIMINPPREKPPGS
jgi:hypothetical protein